MRVTKANGPFVIVEHDGSERVVELEHERAIRL